MVQGYGELKYFNLPKNYSFIHNQEFEFFADYESANLAYVYLVDNEINFFPNNISLVKS